MPNQVHINAAPAMRPGAGRACARGLWRGYGAAVAMSQSFGNKQPQTIVINGKARAHRVHGINA